MHRTLSHTRPPRARLVHARIALAALLACVAGHAAVVAAPASSGTSAAASAPTTAQAALGPTVAYNEAVRIVGGKRVVQLAPRHPNPRRNRDVTKPGSPFGGDAHFMIEAPEGLVQCTVPFYDPAGCEPSNYGTLRKLRTWIVLRNGQWEGCVGLKTPERCRAVYPNTKRITGVMPFEDY
jgi:hypothetical protein